MTIDLRADDVIMIFDLYGLEIRSRMGIEWSDFCCKAQHYRDVFKEETPDIEQKMQSFLRDCEKYAVLRPYLENAANAPSLGMARGVGQHKLPVVTEVDPNRFVVTKSMKEFFEDPDRWLEAKQRDKD